MVIPCFRNVAMIKNPKYNIITIHRMLLFAIGFVLVFQFWHLQKYVESFYGRLRISTGTIYKEILNIASKDRQNYNKVVTQTNLYKNAGVEFEIKEVR